MYVMLEAKRESRKNSILDKVFLLAECECKLVTPHTKQTWGTSA